jgi:two-component system, chemotaxis family, chemotaxis protein CheY
LAASTVSSVVQLTGIILTSETKQTRVALAGHCGPDSSYLRMATSKALPGAHILMVDDDAELRRLLADGLELVLVNRVLDYGFQDETGVDLIRRYRSEFPGGRYMLVSNYPEAQQEAVSAGAMPGFGKREIGSPRVTSLLRDAINVQV